MNITVYDFDKTIYNGETSTDFMKFFLMRNKKYIFRIYKLIPSLLNYRKDLKKSKEYFFQILNGVDINFLKSEIDLFWSTRDHKIFSWVEDEIKKNKLGTEKLILISATPSIFLEKIYIRLGFDILIATDFIDQKDTFQSIIVSKNCKGIEKVNRLRKLISNFNILSFYSDSISDKPLFDLALNKYWIDKGIKKEGLPNAKY